MEQYSFWLGLSGSSSNRFCLCGDDLDRTRRYAVHAFDGRSLLQVCDRCASAYAPTLSEMAHIQRQSIRMTDLLAGKDHCLWQLSPLADREIVELEKVELADDWFRGEQDDDEPDAMAVGASPHEPMPPDWAAVVDADVECATGACGPTR